MKKVLVISGHPNLASSNSNSIILEQLNQKIENISIRRLDSLYSNYKIDVEAEQEALINADIVVLQYPFYWYSMPALLKKWLDDVFSYNFAYGSKGDKLKGKDFIVSFTIGGPDESYNPLGYNHFSIEQFLYPLQQTAYLSGMNFQKPIYSYGMVYIPDVYNTLEEVEQRAHQHAERLAEAINQLANSKENSVKALVKNWFEKMDVLSTDTHYMLAQLADDLVISSPEGEYRGADGFSAWYNILLKTFKPNCQHQLEQIKVTKHNQYYHAELRVRLIAETQSGESINMLVNEEWTVIFEDQKPKIKTYKVIPVQG